MKKNNKRIWFLSMGAVSSATMIVGYAVVGASAQQQPTGLQSNIIAPPSVTAVPGTTDSREYQRLVNRANEEKANQALNSGATSIPILTNPNQKQEDPFANFGVKPEVELPPAVPVIEPSINDSQVIAPPQSTIPEQNGPMQMQEVQMPTYQPVPLPARGQETSAKEEYVRERMQDLLGIWSVGGMEQQVEYNYYGQQQQAAQQPSAGLVPGMPAQMMGMGNTSIPGLTGLPGIGTLNARPLDYTDGVGSSTIRGQNTFVPRAPDIDPLGTRAGVLSPTPVQGSQAIAHIKASTILNAVLIGNVNSDDPVPVVAEVVSGPYKGSRLVGQFVMNRAQDGLVLKFNTISIPNAPKSFAVSALAIDPGTNAGAFATDVDNHTLSRYGSLIAASFLKGYGEAVQQSGATQTTSVGAGGTSSQTTFPVLDAKDKAIIAFGEVGQTLGEGLGRNFNRLPTIKISGQTTIGLFFDQDAFFGR